MTAFCHLRLLPIHSKCHVCPAFKLSAAFSGHQLLSVSVLVGKVFVSQGVKNRHHEYVGEMCTYLSACRLASLLGLFSGYIDRFLQAADHDLFLNQNKPADTKGIAEEFLFLATHPPPHRPSEGAQGGTYLHMVLPLTSY